MPRSYRSDKRRAAAESTRERIVAAARRILRSRRGLGELTIDAVAAEAKVARMSVYNAVKSKSGLLEAILDDISASGLPEILPPSRGAIEALESYLAAFAHFWEAERLSIRRLRALAVLDRDVRAAVARREKRRWNVTLELAARFAEERGKPLSQECIDSFYIAASFESYDRLRMIGRSPHETAREIRLLCRSIMDPVG
ncbi:MAG TPA: TetR/AcrR family transcriptional regulator [Rhizomicrobium sp.]|jgi:AcrR family transcriptional regulator|nr:TetR/AcrR family transcriptional regulator [Rhizomicrobium sp.]